MPKSYKFFVDDCRIIQLPKISDNRGNITFIESNNNIDFEIKRVYYLYDVPGGADRGGHAHRVLYQLLIAVAGSFDVLLNDGTQEKSFHLNRGYEGLLIKPYIWRELNNFSSGAVCLVLASDLFDEADYIRDYKEFISEK